MATREQLRELLLGALEASINHLADGLAGHLQPTAPAAPVSTPAPAPLAASVPPGPVRMVLIRDLIVDPRKYQFRLSTINASGTDDRLRDCAAFKRELAGVVLVWPEPSGQLALLDGHHRLQLAKRSGVEDLACLVVAASSVRDARLLGAMANIAAGNATVPDVARLMRDENLSPTQVQERGVSRKSRLVVDAAALVPLAEELFGRVCTGELCIETGIALAAAGAPAHQRALAQEAERRRWSAEQVLEAARLASVATVTTSAPAGCLPGLQELMAEADSDLGALLAIRAAIRQALKQELRALQVVSRRRDAENLEALQVAVVDTSAATEAVGCSRAASRVFDQLFGLHGPLMAMIRQLAGEVTPKRPASRVVADHLPAIRQAIEAELGG